MSTTLTISLISKRGYERECFIALLQRLKKCAFNQRFVLFNDYVSFNDEENHRVIGDLSTMEELERVFGPKSRIDVEMGVELASGRRIPITVCFCSKEYDSGVPARDNGPLTLTMTIADVARPLWERGGATAENAIKLPDLADICLNDAEDVFFTACGAGEGQAEGGLVKHAAMYEEWGWPSPALCSMVFHHHNSEVVKDLARIYLAFQSGISPITTLLNGQSVWRKESPVGTMVPGRLQGDVYRKIDGIDGDLMVAFMKDLELRTLSKLKDVASDRITNWCRAIDFSQHNVRYHELAGEAVAFTSYPAFKLWKAYKAFYDAALEQ